MARLRTIRSSESAGSSRRGQPGGLGAARAASETEEAIGDVRRERALRVRRQDQADRVVLYLRRDEDLAYERLPLPDPRAVHHLLRLLPFPLGRAVDDRRQL